MEQYVVIYWTEYDDGDNYVDTMDEIAYGPFNSYQEALAYTSKHVSINSIICPLKEAKC